MAEDVAHDGPGLGAMDLHLFNEGRHRRLYERLGAHPLPRGGTSFAVWAPNAVAVSVAHDGNGWTAGADPMGQVGGSGIWAVTVDSVGVGDRYKFAISTAGGARLDKADPFAFATEVPPLTASVVADLHHDWHDEEWMASRGDVLAGDRPLSTYEVHLGSFMRHADGSHLSYEELGEALAAHASALGFTHVELLPVMEHPYYGSWGYQVTGFFAPTARYGKPAGLMSLVDTLHRHGIGVILDWVPSHFATDSYGLGMFDGTQLYEHADPRRATHPDWGSFEFNYGRHEVRSFLLSSACFWLDRYHADGLRVDAVASMLYLDYSRGHGQWVPNRVGGRDDLDATQLIKECTAAVHESFPGTLMIAEESTAWPGVTRPVAEGGLGFDMKWDMGWMNDTLKHLARDPIHRRYHYGELTFRGIYAWSERFVLPLSHDEVVHGKGSLLAKMPGDEWRRFANLRLLFALQAFQPGKKLLFMGSELASWREWDHESSLDWGLLADPARAGIASLVADLNRLHRDHAALHELDFDPSGFAWIVPDDIDNDVLAWLRRDSDGGVVAVVANLTPIVRTDYRVGVPLVGGYDEILNTDADLYGGSGVGNLGHVEATGQAAHGHPASLSLTLPPLAVLAFAPTRRPGGPGDAGGGSARP